MNVRWYAARLSKMPFGEIQHRVRESIVRHVWRRIAGTENAPPLLHDHRPSVSLPPASALDLPVAATRVLLDEADAIRISGIKVFGSRVPMPEGESWFRDTRTQVLAPAAAYAFDINRRDPTVVGDIKFLSEPARLQHVTLLAASYYVSGRECYARAAAASLTSWWAANPVLTGVHWSSGIEVGLRLVSIAWAHRFLAGWSGRSALFEDSRRARAHLFHQQRYLAELSSPGSSANNHLIAEMLGLVTGATEFPWWPESAGWRAHARRVLEREAKRQVFPDGLSREQATEYHGFVLEMFTLAATEARLCHAQMGAGFYETVGHMADAWAAGLDVKGRPPRQGDSDDAFAVQMDAPDRGRRPTSLLAAAEAVVGRSQWWPAPEGDVRSCVLRAVNPPTPARRTHERRPDHFPDAGQVFLRDHDSRVDELWCRLDHGPHGYLSIAAHAHADSLSIELRHGGVDILADPGTYCYTTEAEWREFFRSTRAHNTLEVDGRSQARTAGPFVWLDRPGAELRELSGLDANVSRWRAAHHAYAPGGPVHVRTVEMDRYGREIVIWDELDVRRAHDVRLSFATGPDVACVLEEPCCAHLRWFVGEAEYLASVSLPSELIWSVVRGGCQPPDGWYSAWFGQRVPSNTLVGEGRMSNGRPLVTRISINRTEHGSRRDSPEAER